jgi:uncharacterized membrane protein YhaH (DUF805 family)
MEWMIMPYRRYAEFSGRSGRQEYWMFFLFNMLVYLVLGGAAAVFFIARAASGDTSTDASVPVVGIVMVGLLVIFALATIIPSLAVQVRRFHDQDKSGWFVLLGLIPYAGGLILFIFMLLEGTRGPNQYGADPRDPYNSDVFR